MLKRFLEVVGYKFVQISTHLGSRGELTLSGDRDIEWGFVLARSPKNINRVLDLGPGNSSTPLTLSFLSNEVVALDINLPEKQTAKISNLSYVKGDILNPPVGLGKFDLIINCSTIEHIGLSGRYGSVEVPDGDLIAMKNLRNFLVNDGQMLLTIPVGLDQVFSPKHRIYGTERLPRLLEGWEIIEERYFKKGSVEKLWEETSQEHALAIAGSKTFYSLGLFVLARK
jgi:SAM-dependent methyltransferase